jgi:hypothetical protein
MRRIGVALLVLATCVAAAPARAADPGRWRVTGTPRCRSSITRASPSIPRATSTSTASSSGSTGPTPSFTETARTADVIPPDVHASEGYNHIGDISFGPRGGRPRPAAARVLRPNGPNGGNPCLHGSIGVADPGTLQWRYHVKLDPAEIPEGDVERGLARRHAGVDLEPRRPARLPARRTSRAPTPLRRTRRSTRCGGLKGAVPPTGITGATFVDGRMFVAGQDGKTFRVYSIDLATGSRELEIERTIVGESEGLVTVAAKGRTLGWLIQPFNPEGNPPTYSPDHATLVSFARRAGAVSPGRAGPAGRRVRRRAVARAPLLPPQAPDGAAARLPRRSAVPRGLQGDADREARAPPCSHARASGCGPGPIAKVRVKLTKRGRRVLREDHRRLQVDACGRRCGCRPGSEHEAQGDREASASEARRARARRHPRRRLPRRDRPRASWSKRCRTTRASGRGRRSSDIVRRRSCSATSSPRLQERLPLSAVPAAVSSAPASAAR